MSIFGNFLQWILSTFLLMEQDSLTIFPSFPSLAANSLFLSKKYFKIPKIDFFMSNSVYYVLSLITIFLHTYTYWYLEGNSNKQIFYKHIYTLCLIVFLCVFTLRRKNYSLLFFFNLTDFVSPLTSFSLYYFHSYLPFGHNLMQLKCLQLVKDILL